MKKPQAWWLGIGKMPFMPAMPRHRGHTRRPTWILILVALVCASLIVAYLFPPGHTSACYFFSSSTCSPFNDWLPMRAARVLSDEELAARVVIRDILRLPSTPSNNPKIAFMFLTPGSLPFEKLWEKFFLVNCLTCSFIVLYRLKMLRDIFFVGKGVTSASHTTKKVFG